MSSGINCKFKMYQQFVVFIFLLFLVNAISVEQKSNGFQFLIKRAGEQEWWETAVFYQIYPRSFMDSNNDGKGDIQGIIQKLDYLKGLGITATWLSPIFQSPNVDQGYDISNFRDIDPDYGTLEDLRVLVDKAKDLNIKIILDFVPNHTSDKHNWFQLSLNRTEGYEDFYIWHDGNVTNGNAKPGLPNNWISNFKDSAWEWNEVRQQYYYHAFAIQQPDLNYSNPQVVQEMKDVLQYWLEFGVDGFRFDAVPYLFEDSDFRNESLASGYTIYDANDYDCLEHTLTKDQDATFEMIYQFRAAVDAFLTSNESDVKILMTEAYSLNIENQMLYYGTEDSSTLGAHFTFNFNFIPYMKDKTVSVDEIIDNVNLWLVNMPKQYVANWVLGNHDNHRVATRFGKENVDGFNMLTALLPGVMVTYNGEEIGMENGEVTCEQGFDPQAIKNCTSFAEVSRDFERTPFHWDNTTNAGFNAGNATWLPVSEKYFQNNVASQRETDRSHLNVYKAVIEFRKDFKSLANFDAISLQKLSNNVLQVTRRVDQNEYILVFNAGDSVENVTMSRSQDSYEVVVSSVGSTLATGNKVSKNVLLAGHESILLKGIAGANGANHILPSLFSIIFFCILSLIFNCFD